MSTAIGWKCDECGLEYTTRDEAESCERDHCALRVKAEHDVWNAWREANPDLEGPEAHAAWIGSAEFNMNTGEQTA